MLGNEITIIGDTVVDSCGAAVGVIMHVAFGGLMELLGAIAPTIETVRFGCCKVDCLSMACGIIVYHCG